MKKIFYIPIVALLGCNTLTEDYKIEEEIVNNAIFDFSTVQNRKIAVQVLDNKNVGLSKIPLELYAISSEGRHLLAKSQTDTNGSLELTLTLGHHIDSVAIETKYLGILQKSTLSTKSSLNFLVGGAPQYLHEGILDQSATQGRSTSLYKFIGSYDYNGVPYYLEPVNDYISQDLLDLVNNTLPEQYPVPLYNPQYINDEVSSDTKLRDSAEVWVTFVHEGAGWRNTLGYYTYDINNPPKSSSQIDHLIIFPNVSFLGSGGGMESGNKVYLGTFPANTGIGWFLVPQGWNGQNINESKEIKYSDKDLNTFTSNKYRTHTVLLKDEKRELLLLGMEDTSRPGGDNDFNDAVFYVSVNPFSSVITGDLEETTADTSVDTDKDGVSDKNDNYPNDANKAFDIYTPGENVYGSLAFEDLFPSKGDFDMNDMVIDYNFQSIANVSNKVVEIRAKFKLKALGAMIHSGFGFTLPVLPDKIASIKGQDIIQNSEVMLQANGTESGQSQSVIILFEDGFRSWKAADGRTNTISSQTYIEPIDYELTITFTEPISNSELGYVPYDPFIFNSTKRGIEVHLANGKPTDKATEVFETKDERMPESAYQTYDGLPYGINLPVSFDYPEEGVSISEAYLFFDSWSQSLNTKYRDWYINKKENREQDLIYQKR